MRQVLKLAPKAGGEQFSENSLFVLISMALKEVHLIKCEAHHRMTVDSIDFENGVESFDAKG